MDTNQFRKNNAIATKIKSALMQKFGNGKRIYVSKFDKTGAIKNSNNGMSISELNNWLNQHLQGKARVGISPENLLDNSKIKFISIDIDLKELSMDEKYNLACDIKRKAKEQLGINFAIEKSFSKGYHLHAFFSELVDRKIAKDIMTNFIQSNYDYPIKDGFIEIFPKYNSEYVMFLPYCGLLNEDNSINEMFFERKTNCILDENGDSIRNIQEALATGSCSFNSKNIKIPQVKTNLKTSLPDCFDYAEDNWIEGTRQNFAMALAGISKKKLKISQSEAENLILNIANKNQDKEISQRKAAINSTYKKLDSASILGCSFFDLPECTVCSYNKQNKKSNTQDFKQIKKTDITSLLKSPKDLMQEEDIQWVVKDLFAKKLVSIIFSEPGVGKTVLTMDIAAKLSRGEPIFNTFKVDKPIKVLYFQGDFPNSVMKSRLKQMFTQPDDNYFKAINRYEAEQKNITLGLTSNEGQKNIKVIIDEYKPDFIVFDTFISFFDGDENKQADVKGPIDFLRKVTAEYDCSILLCHHTRKRTNGEKRRGLDQSDMIGSFVTARLSGLMLAISTDTEKTTTLEKVNNVICAKTWFKPIEPFQFIISNIDGYIQVIYTAEEVTVSGKSKIEMSKEKISSFLASMPDIQFQKSHLQKISNVSSRTLSQALEELLASGVISATGKTKDRTYFFDSTKKPNSNKPPKEKIFQENDLI